MSGDYEKDFVQVVKRLRGFLEIVRESGVILLHENEKRIWADTPERVIRLYNEINDPQFKLCFDASNYIQCGVDAAKAYDALKDITEYYHIKDCSKDKVEVPVGMGLGDYKNMIKDLVKRGYDGFYDVGAAHRKICRP